MGHFNNDIIIKNSNPFNSLLTIQKKNLQKQKLLQASRSRCNFYFFQIIIQELAAESQPIQLGHSLTLTSWQPRFHQFSKLNISELEQVFKQPKNKFIVVFRDDIESSLSIMENPAYFDNNQCAYYVLNCYINLHAAQSRSLILFVYVVSEYFYIQEDSPKLAKYIINELNNTQPSNHASKYLFFYFTKEIDSEINRAQSTAYEVYQGILTNKQRFTTQNSQQFEPHIIQSRIFMAPEQTKQKKDNVLLRKLRQYFTDVIILPKVLSDQTKICRKSHQYPSKGLFYRSSDIIEVWEMLLDQTKLINFSKIFLRVFVNNLKYVSQLCKALYIQIIRRWFLQAKSIPFAMLTKFLCENFDKIIQIFNLEFPHHQYLEDYQIHLSILKRWIEQREREVFKLNEVLTDTEMGKYLFKELEKVKTKEQQQLYFKKLNNLPLNTLCSFQPFWRKYFEKLKANLKDLRIVKEKQIQKQINYYENLPERLRNSEDRLTISTKKKQYLETGVKILVDENENLENLENGLTKELEKQKDYIAKNLPPLNKKQKREIQLSPV